MDVLDDLQFMLDNYPDKKSEMYGALARAAELFVSGEDVHLLPLVMSLKRYPVSAEEFFSNTHYTPEPGDIFPEVREHLIRFNEPPHGVRIGTKYNELVATGGIGGAKTTLALKSAKYQLYILSCFIDPRVAFGQDRTSEMVFVFQSLTGKTAKDVNYGRFREDIEATPYFNTEFRFQKDIEAKLVFPNKLEFGPFSSEGKAVISGNTMGGVLDEMNFMEFVEKSKRAEDGGEYDQAKDLFNTVQKRRYSRFAGVHHMPMFIAGVSSRRFPGQFTDWREEAAKQDDTIYVYDKRSWEITPPGRYSGKKFPMFVGARGQQPKVLTEEELEANKDRYPANAIDWVPVELRTQYIENPYDSIRDHSGISTVALNPFFQNLTAVGVALHGYNIFKKELDDLSDPESVIDLSVIPEEARKFPRFAHIDLAVSLDIAGFGISHVRGFKKVTIQGVEEFLPDIVTDGAMGVTVDKELGEINYENIRRMMYFIIENGIPLKFMTADSFQSVDTRQMMRRVGVRTGEQSVDRTMQPYLLFRRLINAGAWHGPLSPIEVAGVTKDTRLYRELSRLEQDIKKQKVDHRVGESKDIADACCGSVYGLFTMRAIWHQFGVPIKAHVVQKMLKEA